MSDDADAVRARLDAMVAKRGGMGPASAYHRILAELGEEVFDAYDRWYSVAMLGQREGGLDRRTRTLIIVALAALKHEKEPLQLYAKKALSLGVRPHELYEAVLMTGVTGGMPCLKDALPALAEIVPPPQLPPLEPTPTAERRGET